MTGRNRRPTRSVSRRSLSPLKAFFVATPVVLGFLALVAMASTSDLSDLTTVDGTDGTDSTSPTSAPTTETSIDGPADTVVGDGATDETVVDPGQPDGVGEETEDEVTSPTSEADVSTDPEPDEDTAVTIDADGSATDAEATATPSPGGAVPDQDPPAEGTANQPTGSAPSAGADTVDGSDEGSGDSFVDRLKTLGILVLSGVGVIVFVYLAASLLRSLLSGRRTDSDEEDDGDLLLGADGEPMIDPVIALDRLAEELTAEPHPRQAIRRAYAVVESGFGHRELARKRGETPLLYLERALGSIENGDAELGELTQLFVLARYSDHEITEPMRRSAVDAVVALRDRYSDAAKMVAVAV